LKLTKEFFAVFHGFQVPTSTISHKIRKLAISLHSTDRLLIAFWCLLSLVSLILHARIPDWRMIVLGSLAAAVVTCALAYAARAVDSRVLRWIHDWGAFPMVVFTYKQIYFMIRPIHQGRDYDQLLIAVDRALFGVNPTEWLAGFSNPCLTEVLQIAYSLFYVFFVAVGLELYLQKDLLQFRRFRFTVVYGFFISYIGYFFLPAVGPRFILHDFSRIDIELPGLLLTPFLRWFVNIWESIPPGVSNVAALACAQRDVLPSGHTMMTLIAMVLAYKFRLRVRYCVLGMGVLLIFGTVYLRYHYFIDVAAGALLVLPCLLTADKLHALFRSSSPGEEH
jgi:membrane-associated phospholipid phosphatase